MISNIVAVKLVSVIVLLTNEHFTGGPPHCTMKVIIKGSYLLTYWLVSTTHLRLHSIAPMPVEYHNCPS